MGLFHWLSRLSIFSGEVGPEIDSALLRGQTSDDSSLKNRQKAPFVLEIQRSRRYIKNTSVAAEVIIRPFELTRIPNHEKDFPLEAGEFPQGAV